MDAFRSGSMPPVPPPSVGSSAFQAWLSGLLAECQIVVEQSRSLRLMLQVTLEHARGAAAAASRFSVLAGR